MAIFPSLANTAAVPTITAVASETSPQAKPIVNMAPVDLIARVRNNSLGAYVLVAYELAALMSFPNWAAVYKLPAGAVETFVVAKGQQLFVASPGVGCEISYVVAEALPTDQV